MEKLASALRLDPEQIQFLPPSFLERAIASLSLPLEEEAALLFSIHSARHADSLADYFKRSEERTREPWRIIADRSQDLFSRASARSDEEVESTFIDAAKSGLLTPDLALAACYGVCGTAESRKFFASLLTLPEQARLNMHNYVVARACGEPFLDAMGAQLEHLKLPLFPPLPSLRSLNTKLIAESQSGAGGLSSLFLTASEGGGVLPVLEGPHGLFVDITSVEQAFNELFASVKSIQALSVSSADNIAAFQKIREQLSSLRRNLRNKNHNNKNRRYRGGEPQPAPPPPKN